MKSIKKNYIYNLMLTVSNIMFPILILPYVIRKIGPMGIGKINYSLALISYFILLAQFGIPTYGIKEISKLFGSDNK